MQLANYLLSRKHVSKVRSASQLLSALTTLSANEFHIPVSISLEKLASISATNKKVCAACIPHIIELNIVRAGLVGCLNGDFVLCNTLNHGSIQLLALNKLKSQGHSMTAMTFEHSNNNLLARWLSYLSSYVMDRCQ